MNDDSGPKAGLKGVVEDAKGKVKKIIGSATGNDSLEAEGEDQEAKAAAQREVARHEAEAEASRAEADAHETAQRAEQKR